MTSFLTDYGVAAVFVLMAIDAVFPAASEAVMLYGGALASGALTHQLKVFGWETSGLGAYLAVVVAGVLGYQLGAIGGWWLGRRGGRPFLERRGRLVHWDRADRARRTLVRPLGLLGRASRAPDADRALVRLDPRGPLREPLRALQPAHPDRKRDLVPLLRGDRAGPSGRAGTPSTTASVSSTSPSSSIVVLAAAALVVRLLRRGGAATIKPVVKIPHVDVAAQYAPLRAELEAAFAKTLDTGRFIFGPEVEAFEREAAEHLGVAGVRQLRERHRRARARARRARRSARATR